MISIYALKLEGGKYYVGKTRSINFRLQSHANGIASEWTKAHRPVKLVRVWKNCDDYDEDKYTIMYMKRYGIQNVRGGSFATRVLDDDTVRHLEKMINGSKDRCFKCGKSSHFARDCILQNKYEDSDSESDSDLDSDQREEVSDSGDHDKKCFRCGRTGHFVSNCYASTHFKGYLLD
jgi:hypothetical protein